MDPLIGQMINRYQIMSLLGEGGMGAVYKGRDITLQRDVAIKLMHSQFSRQPEFQQRFLQEARTAARFDQPSIVQVYDFGRVNDQLYIVMEFIPGKNLRKLMEDMRAQGKWILMPEGVQIVRQVCTAIDYAHQRGVLHRDIKPENIMLKPEPSKGLPYRPIVTDLGLAKLAEGGMATQDGTSMGTPPYMSPEQAMGQTVDARSDVYSLGILLYELTVGRTPFPAKTLTQAIQYHTRELPPPPHTIRADIPPALEAIILKALEKKPDDRFTTAADMADALKGLSPNAPQTPQPDAQPTALQNAVSLSTQAQEGPEQSRGPSIFNEFETPASQSGALIQVLAPGKNSRSLPLKKSGMTIGRDPANDIFLDDPKVSRHHARIEYDGQTCRLVDLDSANGTFLANARLLPGVPEAWTPDKALRIGDTWLRLLLQPAAGQNTFSGSGMRVKPDGTMMDATRIHSSPGAGQVGIFLATQQFNVDPGGSLTVPLTLLNQGSLVDHFQVSVDGIPAAWVTSLPPSVQLLPGDQSDVSFTIQPPRTSASRAGAYPLIIRVRSQDVPNQVAEVKAALSVSSFTQFTSDLHPEKIPAGKSARVGIRNLGNTLQTFNLKWQDRGDELRFTPAQAQVQVPAGGSAEAEFRAAPATRPLIGGEKSIPFTLQVNGVGEDPHTHSGELVSRGRIPIWVIPVVSVLLFLCLGGMAALAAAGKNLFSGSAATPTATVIALATAQNPTQMVVVAGNPPITDATPTNAANVGLQATPTTMPVTAATLPPLALTILHPDATELQNPINRVLVFQAQAFDPMAGTNDGVGITSVDMSVIDSGNQVVYKRTESNAPYCFLSEDGAACKKLDLLASAGRWPDGKRIKNGSYTLRAVATSKDGRKATAETKVDIQSTPWIVFTSNRNGNQELYAGTSDAAQQVRLTNDPTNHHVGAAWSPDGKKIAFLAGSTNGFDITNKNDIFVMNADGSGLKRLTNASFSHLYISWSPNGKILLFSSNDAGNRDIYRIDADGKNMNNLTNDPSYDTQPRWSPDGKKIAFRSDRSGQEEIYVMDADGSNLTQLTTLGSPLYDPYWSPDGKHIVFYSDKPDARGVYVMDPDGSNLVNISSNSVDSLPSWSPNSRQIVFTSYRNNQTGVYIFNIDGSGIKQLASGPTGLQFGAPFFSPDGQSVIFSKINQNTSEMDVVRTDGSNMVRLTDGSTLDIDPAWQP